MENLWWTAVPNSVRFIDEIVAAFNEGSSVVCVIPKNCEWKDDLREIIQERILSGVNKTYEISGKDTAGRCPGEILMKKFVKPELRLQYRTSIGYEKFLTKNEGETSLVHSYIYLKDMNDDQVLEWLDFIHSYNKLHNHDEAGCKFILESSVNVMEEQKDIKVIRRSDHIHAHDITILCMMTASSQPLADTFKDYSVELAALCSQNDPEFAYELIIHGNDLIRNTECVIKKAITDSVRSDFTSFEDVNGVNRNIWKAQLKVFFALIERYRLYIIEKYENEFPKHKSIKNMIGETITSIYDIELNTIQHLRTNGDLFMPKEDYAELCFFKECRNDLAHLKILPYDSLERIVSVIDRIQ